jgi:hypothetical protein
MVSTTATILGIPAEATASPSPGIHARAKDAAQLFALPMGPTSPTVHELLTCFDNTVPR